MHLITCPNWLLLWHGCFISGRLALHLHFHKNNWCALGNYSNDDIFQISLIPFFFAGRKQASRWIFSSWLSCLSSGGQRSPSRWARASKLSYIHIYASAIQSLDVVCVYGCLYAQVGWPFLSPCKQGKRHIIENPHTAGLSIPEGIFLALFPHILGVLLFMGFSQSDNLWDSPKTLNNIPELTDKEETPSFWMLFNSKSWRIPWCHPFSVCLLYLCYYLFLFDLLEPKCRGDVRTAKQNPVLLVNMLSLGICLKPQPHR